MIVFTLVGFVIVTPLFYRLYRYQYKKHGTILPGLYDSRYSFIDDFYEFAFSSKINLLVIMLCMVYWAFMALIIFGIINISLT